MRVMGLAHGIQEMLLFILDLGPLGGPLASAVPHPTSHLRQGALQGAALPGPPGGVLLHGGWRAQEPKAWLRRLTASWGGVLGWVWPGTPQVGQLHGGESEWFFRSSQDKWKRWGEHGVWAPRRCSVGRSGGGAPRTSASSSWPWLERRTLLRI